MPNLKTRFLFLLAIGISSTAFCQNAAFTLKDFYTDSTSLDMKVDSIFNTLSDTSKVAQMIVTSAGELGKPEKTVLTLAKENKLGGVIFLKGSKTSHKRMIDELNGISSSQNQIPLMFSIDAEPSLYNSRLKGSQKVMNTIDIKTPAEADSIARIINTELLELGFHQNFAPVCDVSPQNEAIKNRSFGSDPKQVIELSKQYIETTQDQGIVATAKHFPGHGLVVGDTHKKSVYIDGDLQELEVYPPLIEAGVISIMMGHITIRNNEKYDTKDLPASCSRNMVTGLLKEELGFEGLIITDALNIMKAVTIIDNAPLVASMAGCDILLMPIDETKTINSILAEMEKNEAYKLQVYDSIKKILKLKICLGLL